MMGEFEAIRPYSDAEVPAVLQRLLSDDAFLGALVRYRFPRLAGPLGWLLKPLIAHRLAREVTGIRSVATLQDKFEPYVDHTIEKATDGVTYSGVNRLKPGCAYLFIANHRDIVMDPAFVNYAVYHAGLPTPRIAIGDNLLQKSFVSDLMRLNKSFIVHRSLSGRREKLAAYQTLSAYINHSIREDRQSVWIAQAEGRAKDGDDRTDSAILKMFHMSRKDEPFAEMVRALHFIRCRSATNTTPATWPRPRVAHPRQHRRVPQGTGRGRCQHRPGHHRLQGPRAHQLRRRAGGRVQRRQAAGRRTGPADPRQLPSVPGALPGLRDEREPRPGPRRPHGREPVRQRGAGEGAQGMEPPPGAMPGRAAPWLVLQYANPVLNQYRIKQQS